MSPTDNNPAVAELQMSMRNLPDMLFSSIRRRPSCRIYVVPDQPLQEVTFLTHSMLLDEAKCLLSGLKRVRPTRRHVALLLDRPCDFLPAFWACMLGGYIPCPMSLIRNDRERWTKHIMHIDTLLDRPLFVCAESLGSELPRTVAFAELDT